MKELRDAGVNFELANVRDGRVKTQKFEQLLQQEMNFGRIPSLEGTLTTLQSEVAQLGREANPHHNEYFNQHKQELVNNSRDMRFWKDGVEYKVNSLTETGDLHLSQV